MDGRARAPPPGDRGRERGAGLVGWASLNSFNPRPAYDHVADLSVYIERGWRGKGVGRRLIDRLLELGREIGYHKLVLAAFPFNPAGMALYERMGSARSGSIASRAASTAAGSTPS